jgi:RNA polymerase sigma-70 factor (ECF subfamily)
MTDLAPAPDAGTGLLEEQLEQQRTHLTGYCYRMLGSVFDAEDAVQETMVRAWRSIDGFEGRSSLRSWLFRIAHRVCLDALAGRQRRALPMDLSAEPSAPVQSSLGVPQPRGAWVEPVLDAAVVPAHGDPAEVAVARESVRLAFVAALQHLPPRQRSVLVLREVLRWRAEEVAQLLQTSVASVNSALQRARATLAAHDVTAAGAPAPLDDGDRELLARYVDAFERYDMVALVAVLTEDATQCMPPYALWLRGRDDLVTWMLGPGAACRGSRLLPVAVSGAPAFAQYKPDGAGGRAPWAIHVLQLRDGRVAGTTSFLDTALFDRFGLPARLP